MSFSRRVSFDNLTNDDIHELHKYNRRRRYSTTSILKNHLNQSQLHNNLQHSELTINYHQDLSDSDDSDDDHHHDHDDNHGDMFTNVIKPNTTQINGRRKSYSEMTDEELMSLDPQFATPKTSNLDQFKFDNAKTYYLSTRKNYNVLNGKSNFIRDELKPSHNYKSFNITMKSESFNATYERTILCIFNGRKHTWRSIYWLLTLNFLQNNDYIVLSSMIPQEFITKHPHHYKKLLKEKCSHLMNWILSFLPNLNLHLKITIELIIENSNKKFIQNLFGQYNPNLLIISNKSTNLNFKYPVRLNQSIGNNFLLKYSSYVIKYSTIPTIVINANHHIDRKNSVVLLDSIDSGLHETNRLVNYHDPKTYIDLITEPSDRSLSDSLAYLQQLNSKNSNNTHDHHHHQHHHQHQSTTNSNCNNNSSLGDEEIGVKFNESVRFNSKVHSIYSSQLSKQNSSTSDKIYKVRSLIDDAGSSSTNQTSNSSNSIVLTKSNQSAGLTNKQIKSNLKAKKIDPPKKKGFWKKLFSS